MTEEPQPIVQPKSPPTRAAPPTSPGVPHRPKATWPNVLGIVLIVFGVGAALGGVWSAIGFWAMRLLIPAIDDIPIAAGAMREMQWMMIPLGVAAIAAGVWCAIAGVGLVRRQPWAPRSAAWWALAKIILGVATAGVNVFMQHTMMQAQVSSTGGAGSPSFMPIFYDVWAVLMFAMYTCWFAALPVFTLLWLRMNSVRAEIAQWSVPTASESA